MDWKNIIWRWVRKHWEMDKRGWEDLGAGYYRCCEVQSCTVGRMGGEAWERWVCSFVGRIGIIAIILNNCDVHSIVRPSDLEAILSPPRFSLDTSDSFTSSDSDSDQRSGRIYGLVAMGQGEGGILTLSWGWCYTNWEPVVYLLNHHFVFILSLSRRNLQRPRSVASTDNKIIIKSPA